MDLTKISKIACHTVILAIVFAAAPLAGTSHATIFTWDGQISNSWGGSRNVGSVIVPKINSNWEPDGYTTLQLPTSSDDVIFGEFTAYNRTVNLNGTRSVKSLEFKNSQNFTLTNGTLLLASGDLTSTGSNTRTLDADITLQSNGTWDVSGGFVFVNGRLYSGNDLTKTGANSLYLNNNNNLVHDTFISEGAILIRDDGSLTNSNGSIGNSPGVTFAGVYVSGENASWTNTEDLRVGSLGYGILNITLGGTVTSYNGSIGESAGSSGYVNIYGTNSSLNTTILTVGDSGNGIFDIQGGSTSTSSWGSIVGSEAGSTGVVTVSGENSTWNTPYLRLGEEGDGTLNIENGGTVLSDYVDVGNFDGSTSSATVTGANSTWVITDTLSLSRGRAFLAYLPGGSSVLDISNGGIVSSVNGGMSAEHRDSGVSTVTVSGTNAAWNNSDTLTVGFGLDQDDISTSGATLNIETGGTVSAGNKIRLNSTGQINLLGGTLRTANIEFAIDKGINFYSGTLHLTQSTLIDYSNIFDLDVKKLLSGQTLRVDGTTTLQTPLKLNGGKLSTDSIVGFNNINFQSGTFELTYGDFTIGSTGLAGPNVSLPAGANIEVANNAIIAADGVLNLNGGFLLADNLLTNNGTIIIAANKSAVFGNVVHNGPEIRTSTGAYTFIYGSYSGEGDFTGPGEVYFFTEVHPGNSTGVVDMEGNVAFVAGSSLFIELAGLLAGEFDQLAIAGDASLYGNLEIDLLDGFLLSPGNEFEILDIAGTLSGQFDGLGEGDLVGTFGGQDLFISYNAGDGNDIALFTQGISGDFDSDNDVDGSDFLSLQRGIGTYYSSNALNTWYANFGANSNPGLAAFTTAVPEPSTGILFLLGIVAMFSRRAVSVK